MTEFPPSVTATTPTPPDPGDALLRLLSGAWMTQALHAASELKLADELARGPRTAGELGRASGALPDRVARLLRALASEGVFREREDGRFENTPVSEVLRDRPGGFGATIRMTAREHYVGWGRFLDCLRERQTAFEIAFGEPVFAWYAQQPAEAQNFQRAMAEYSFHQLPAILAAFDPSPYRRIFDVGGGHGGFLRALLERAPAARGVVYDLEQGLAGARAQGLDRDPRVELDAGDFFESVPAGGDLYVLKFILHDWDDERCVTILRHVRAGLASGGKVLVAEHLIAGPNEPDPAKWVDLHMMAMPGGLERTREEFERLFASAGLRLARVAPTQAGIALLEAEAEV